MTEIEPRLRDFPPFDKAEPLPDEIWIWDTWGFASFPPVWRQIKAAFKGRRRLSDRLLRRDRQG